MKIGFFDSGFGGLDIMREVVKTLPEYDYVYLGDTARTPYGTRSEEVIYQYTKDAVDYLFQQDCKLIILVCNTASADALPRIQKEYLPKHYPDRNVLGVIIPACEEASVFSENGRVGVMATDSTVNSGAFVREISKLNPQLQAYVFEELLLNII